MKPQASEKLAEMIALADRIAVGDLDPAMEFVERGMPRRADQLFDHARSPIRVAPDREVRDGPAEIKRR